MIFGRWELIWNKVRWWPSGMINNPNPNFPGKVSPESYRQEVLDAISKATGRKAYSGVLRLMV